MCCSGNSLHILIIHVVVTKYNQKWKFFEEHGNFVSLVKKKELYEIFVQFSYGGDGEDRTLDLHTASVALSQLSYAPIGLSSFLQT